MPPSRACSRRSGAWATGSGHSIRAQLAALALVAVGIPVGAILASGIVMLKPHDFVEIVAVAGVSALVALAAALALGRRILSPLANLGSLPRGSPAET